MFNGGQVAINKITNRSITGGDSKKQHAFSLNPFPFAEVKNGMVELIMYSKDVPYFIDLKARGYTSYQLNIALTLKSVYSQRLYELLSRFKDTGKWHVEIERFKFLLGIDKEKTFMGNLANGNLKSKVIEPAMKELAEKTEIEFNYSFQKTGKKYTAIAFDIYTQKLIKHIETADAKADAVEVLEQLAEARPGQQMAYLHIALSRYEFTDAQRQKIIKSNPVTVKFLHIHAQIETGAIKVETTPTRLMAWHLRQLGWS